MIKKTWREIQKTFFDVKGHIEFEQDLRILNFFADSTDRLIYGYGDVDYFSDKLNLSDINDYYNSGLIVINHELEVNDFIKELKEIKKKLVNADKIAIGINKFLLYTEQGNTTVNENYDMALKDIIIKEFNKFSLKHYCNVNTKGNVFNFASPVTQFFLTL